ncbi:hypothetical protein ACIPUD_36615 [Bradyrhizobium sp. CAR08]
MPYFVCAREGAGQIVLKRDTREAAEKKAAELLDVGCFEVEVIAKPEQCGLIARHSDLFRSPPIPLAGPRQCFPRMPMMPNLTSPFDRTTHSSERDKIRAHAKGEEQPSCKFARAHRSREPAVDCYTDRREAKSGRVEQDGEELAP